MVEFSGVSSSFLPRELGAIGMRVDLGIRQKSYENKGITDNNWNTLKFLSCPVDPHGRIAPSNSLVNVSRK